MAAGTCSTPSTKRCSANRGPATCPPAETEAALYADGYKPPPGSQPKAVRVNPGTVLVQARPVELAGGKLGNRNPNSWYVLNDDPALDGNEITNPQQSDDEGAGESGQPVVSFGFDSRGKKVFQQVTKELAQRGQEAQLPGVSKEAALQHFAVALDGSLITTPSIDFTQFPDGIDTTNGSEITGDFTLSSAQELANELQRRAAAAPGADLPRRSPRRSANRRSSRACSRAWRACWSCAFSCSSSTACSA